MRSPAALPLQDFPGWEGAPANPDTPAEATITGIAQVLTGNSWEVAPANLWRGQLGPAEVWTGGIPSTWTSQHWEAGTRLRTAGEPVAVAFTPAGQLVVQSREPATLQFEDGSVVQQVDLVEFLRTL